MGSDVWLVFRWWGTLFLVGTAAWPLTKALFGLDPRLRGDDKKEGDDNEKDGRATAELRWYRGEGLALRSEATNGWWDGGYLFSKAVGMAVVTWMVYVMGTVKILPFSPTSIIISLAALFLLGLFLNIKNQKFPARPQGRAKIKDRDEKLKKQESEIPAFAGMTRWEAGVTRWEAGVTRWEAGMTLTKAGVLFLEELFFFVALLFWSWVKAHEPSIRGLEKFMDFGFMQSILNSQYFPPADMWYAGLPINYYYFGHMVTAVLTKLSGLDLAYTFNLMLASLFALTLTMSFSIGYQLVNMSSRPSPGSSPGLGNRDPASDLNRMPDQVRHDKAKTLANICGAVLTAFLVTLAGNMQTIYAFTRGYSGEHVEPFWELVWGTPLRQGFVGHVGELWGKLGEGMNTYWYANATRFIPYTIHEFPGYSFVVSDVHGHVLSIPFVLLAIGIMIRLLSKAPVLSSRSESRDPVYYPLDLRVIGDDKENGFRVKTSTVSSVEPTGMTHVIFYGFLVGVLLMTNALDGPIYFALASLVLVMSNVKCQMPNWKTLCIKIATIVGIAAVTSLPFLSHFKSFVSGVAVNCPPSLLANRTFGPIIFEGVEKCQISPLWMWWLLWGFFVYCGFSLMVRHSGRSLPRTPMRGAGIQSLLNGSRVKPGMTEKKVLDNYSTHIEKLLFIFFVFALALVIFPEFFYFKDIYPAHFRSNTMFKLGYQAFVLFSIVSGYSIVRVLFHLLDHSDRNVQCQMSNVKWGRRIFLMFLVPQLFLVSIFPIFAVRSYFGELKTYEGIYGLGWLSREYPEDWAGIEWLKSQVDGEKWKVKSEKPNNTLHSSLYTSDFTLPTLVEADGDSYTDYARYSAFTGIPTIIGWPVHEWLWRGSYDVVAPRREEVRQIYESEDLVLTRMLLIKYGVRYVVVGKLEREKYTGLQEWKFGSREEGSRSAGELGGEAFRSGKTVIYGIR